MTNRNRVFTKQQIYQLIWNDAYYGDENIINVHIRRLREKLKTIHPILDILKHFGESAINLKDKQIMILLLLMIVLLVGIIIFQVRAKTTERYDSIHASKTASNH